MVKKIWLKNYQKGINQHIDINTYSSINDLFEQSCQQFATLPAYENFGTQLSYQEIYDKSQAFGAYLQQTLKLKKGDRVAIMLPNTLQYPIAFFGALQAGLIIVNTNPLYTADEVIHQMNDAGVKVVLVLANVAHTIEKALGQLKTVEQVIVTEIGDLFPFVKKQLFNNVTKYVKRLVPNYQLPQALHFNEVLEAGEALKLNVTQVTHDDIALLQYTGGTTGVAKGAMLTHGNMVANVLQATDWISPLAEPGKEVIITAIPLYHIFSLTANCLSFLRFGGLNVLITDPRDFPRFIKTIANAHFTAITGVNTLFNALNNNEAFAKDVDFSKLKYALAGGMALQEHVAQSWLSITDKPVVEAFGLTETSPAVTINPVKQTKYNGSIGLPLPSTEIKICNEKGKEVSIGEEGELCIRGPQVMKGYWQREEATKEVLSADGWLKTGDIARVDKEGFVYLVDRKKDMIIVSGFNVYPNEVEAVIANHPDVDEVGVVGVPYNDSGERVKACVVRLHDNLNEETLLTYCREHLTAYKVPKIIEFVNELPKTNVGKILRRKLKESHVNTPKENNQTAEAV